MPEQLFTLDMIKNIAFAVTGMFIPFVGIGIGLIGYSANLGISKNPTAEPKIRTMSILAIAFCESIAIFAIVLALLVKFG
jgi:F-type H+-transporting ATPase subunit c